MIDILKLYKDKRIDFREHGHKHCRSGWIQIECPFCTGNPGYHLGYCVDLNNKFAGAFVCWRCGGKHPNKVIQEILNIPRSEVKEIISTYRLSGSSGPAVTTQVKIVKNQFKFPSGCSEMKEHHKKYLMKRKFDPEELERDWGILGTGPISSLSCGYGENKKVIDYKNRIVIPIEWEGRIVTFQARAITKASKLKYLACPEERELMSIKSVLYGKSDRKRCGLVEGVTDVWRLGKGVMTTFGIKYTLAQIQLLRKYEEVFIIFDPEEQAQIQAKKLEASLNFRGVRTKRIGDLPSDPGDMSQDDANHLMKELGLC